MKKVTKDFLRYIIFIGVSIYMIQNTDWIVGFIMEHYIDINLQVALALLGVNASIIAVWGYYAKKFVETKAEGL